MRPAALLLTVLLCALPLASVAHAQALPGIEDLDVVISPQYPRPYDTVTVSVSSNQIDLAAADITISVNGKAVGEGDRTAAFTAGAAGTKTSVAVSAKDATGDHQASLTFYPEDLALVVEPDSTVPPLYPGAALPTSEGNIRIVALPDFRTSAGAAIAPSSLAYTWRFGEQVLEAQSGLGRSVLTATGPVRYRNADIRVTVATQDGNYSAQAETSVVPVDPLMRIYQDDPLRGIDFSAALSGVFALMGDEATFRAEPFYYGTRPQVAWSLNGTESGSDPDLTVRATGASAGTALVGASANDPSALNNAQASFTVQFSKARSTGIFGL